MRKHKLYAFCCAILSFVLMFSAVSCGNTAESGSESQSEQTKSEYDVWGTYATAKVGQDSAKNGNFYKMAGELDVAMMKNETEGGQVIITANSDVAEFDVNVGELKTSDGKVFPQSQVTVYQQKYLQVKQKSDFNGVYTIGEYVPDMLLEMSIAKKYKENHVKAGDNQGIYVEFNSKNVEAGIYTGTYEIDCDGVKTNVPVSVEVWDIEYTGDRTFQSCFVMYQTTLLRSEYDNSEEMVNNYVDFFLDYKVDICLHNKRRNNFDAYGADWLRSVERLKDSENHNSIYIPYQFPPSFVAYSGDNPSAQAEECLKYVLGLAEICTPDNFYLDYAYFYPFELDEADIVDHRVANAERMLVEGGDVDQMLQLAVERVENDNSGKFGSLKAQYGDEFIERIKAAILNIPTLFTNVGFVENWVDGFSSAFCPYLSVFTDGRFAEHYVDSAKEKGTDVWAYTCVGPTYPYPTFHIDDYNLGTRISGWMEKYFGINGYLYWAVSNDFCLGEEYKYVDTYTDPTRYKGADGDGYLVYPGKYYGSTSPLPSLRLVAYRDSMDDYDMLCVYENLLKEYYAKYDLGELNFNEYVDDLYYSLFKGAIYYTDDALVFAARKELAKRILALQNEDGIMLVQNHNNGETKATVYASVETLTINGKSVSGQKVGEKDAYRFDLTETSGNVIVKSEKSDVSFSLKEVASIQISKNNVTTSADSTSNVGDYYVTANLKAKLFGNSFDDAQTISFTPYLAISADNIAKAQRLCATVKNESGEAADLYVKVISNGMVYEVGSTYVKDGVTKDIRLNLSTIANLSGTVQIQFYVQNVVTNDRNEAALQSDKTFTISNLYVEM